MLKLSHHSELQSYVFVAPKRLITLPLMKPSRLRFYKLLTPTENLDNMLEK